MYKGITKKILIIGLCLGASSVFAYSEDKIGLYNVDDFKQVNGDCLDCAVIPQALWYFQNERVSVPKDKNKITQTLLLNHQYDVKYFYDKNKRMSDGSMPSLIWTGSPDKIEGFLEKDAKSFKGGNGKVINFEPTKKIDTNLSYYNENSVAFFGGKEIISRGVLKDDKYVARTLWLKNFNLNKGMKVEPLNNTKIIDLVKEKSLSDNDMTTRVLWSRDGKEVSVQNKPILAFVLNGAQGDDDEAHGGHFAVATGMFGKNGEWDSWLVNNFYGINSFSEKGITASILPMDAYQGDLNSGQSWYRPSYMLVAVLKDKKVPELYQESINRVFNHFYKHDFEYNHALSNCTGINIETLRTLGWNIPKQGSESTLKAFAALPYVAITKQDLSKGKKAFDYLSAEMTSLYPLVGFDAIGNDLLNRIVKGEKPNSEFEKSLMEDIEAIVYIKLPQFPSSRAMGQAPVGSMDEYMKRVPENDSDWKIVPVESRPFPEKLKESNISSLSPSDYAIMLYCAIIVIVFGFATKKIVGKIINRKGKTNE